MSELLKNSVYFGVFITIAAFWIGTLLKKRFSHPLANPTIIGFLLVIVVLLICNIDYETYNEGAKYITYFLTPATICLAVPLYEQVTLLKEHFWAVMGGVLAGVLSSLLSIFFIAWMFRMDHASYVSLLSKSVTTAIGTSITEELGGIVPLAVIGIMSTGIVGGVIGELVCKLFRITHPIAVGLAMGASAHAMATARAIEIGPVEGAMSSLSMVVSGILTVVGASIFAGFI